MSKHTPGPWASSGLGVVQAETGELICAAVYEDGEPYQNAEANMQAIEALPDLLQALKDCVNGLGCQPGYVNTLALRRAQSVIERIEGGA